MKKDWEKLEEYVVERLKEIDKYCRTTKGSGNSTEKNDIKTSCGLACECKQRNTKSITVNDMVWEKLKENIPLHSSSIPVLILENKNKKRWAVLDFDDFINIYIQFYKNEN